MANRGLVSNLVSCAVGCGSHTAPERAGVWLTQHREVSGSSPVSPPNLPRMNRRPSLGGRRFLRSGPRPRRMSAQSHRREVGCNCRGERCGSRPGDYSRGLDFERVFPPTHRVG
jgi:hypothetical protein